MDEGGAAVEVDIDRAVCRLIHQFVKGLDAHVRQVADKVGLTPSQVVALRELTAPLTARELAGRMSCEPPNATFVIDRLEEQGLVLRLPDPNDRRAKQIELTERGREVRSRVLDELGTESPLRTLSAAQQHKLVDLLGILVEPEPYNNPADLR